ncbi:response regulator transcription factor [Bacillus cytotoxicus]|uniref:response regulator transcription factor n=1 Tax=Bacillus cytotoxicus TaxID=580165 RepID=UPI003C79CDAD
MESREFKNFGGDIVRQETILVVDDEKEIRDLITIYLKNEGYNILQAGDGAEGLEILENNEVHLVVLDIMMPKIDGIHMCMKVREQKEMPIIMLSAKTQDMDKILGLTTGADDYVTKPFNPLELVARVKSQLRRYMKMSGFMIENENEIEIGDIKINVSTHEVVVADREVKLTPREFSILELLVRNSGMVFSTEQIYEKVWNERSFQSDNTVMVHIRKIREKVEENARKPRYIKTVWGVGYKVEKEN